VAFFGPCFTTHITFLLIMVVSGLGPYHCQQPNDTPAECAGITPTPWGIMPTLGFVSYCRGHELLVTPPPHNVFVGFVFQVRKLEARRWCKGPDDVRNASKEMLQETQGTGARKHCKGHDDARDASKAASRGRQRRKGGDRCCIVVVNAMCNSSHINSKKYNFF
jgi:hypothetical protein